MLLTEDNDMIQAISPDRTDEPFGVSILPGDRAEVGRSRMPMAPRRRIKAPPYAPIAITNDVSWRLAATTSFGQLTGNPFSTRMRGHAGPQNFSPGMPQDEKPIQ